MKIKKTVGIISCCIAILLSAVFPFYAKADYSCDYMYNALKTQSDRDFYDGLLKTCQLVDESSKNYEYIPYVSYSSDMSIERVDEIVLIFCMDHPEFFWISLDVKYSNLLGFSFRLLDRFQNGTLRQQAKSSIRSAAQVYINAASKLSSDMEKAKLVQDMLLKNVTYQTSDWDQSIASVFLQGTTVCAGFSKAYEYICNSLGIDTIIITSYVHAWNAVNIGGRWYLVDVTNDRYSNRFFLISDSRMDQIDKTLEERYKVTGEINGEEVTKVFEMHDLDIFSYLEYYDAFPKCAYTFGDANGDDVRNVLDASYIAHMLAQGRPEALDFRADFDLDNRISVHDASALAKAIAGGA